MKLNKQVRLDQLRSELHAAGILGEFGIAGDDLHTYNARGEVVDVPAGARAVIDAHVPVFPSPPNWGTLRQAIRDAATTNAKIDAIIAYLDAIPKT